jgi:hypothetical protein
MRFEAFLPRQPLGPQICRAARERIAAAAGLTMRQRSSAFWIDPEPAIGVFMISKPRRGLSTGAVRLR